MRKKFPNRKTLESCGLVILKDATLEKAHFSSNATNHCCLTSLGQQPLPARHTLNMTATAAPTASVPATMAVIAGALTWSQLFAHAEQIFAKPWWSSECLLPPCSPPQKPPKALLVKLEALAQLSPIMIAMVSDKEPDCITLLKNP